MGTNGEHIGKTKGLVVGQHLEESDIEEVQLEGGAVEVVEDFTYLDNNITKGWRDSR